MLQSKPQKPDLRFSNFFLLEAVKLFDASQSQAPPIGYDSNNIFYPSKSAAFHPMISGARQGNRHGLDNFAGCLPRYLLKRRPIANFNLHRLST